MEPGEFQRQEQFSEYRRLFISELERLDRTISTFGIKIDELAADFRGSLSKMERELTSRIGKLETELALLKFKVFLIGATAGTILSAAWKIIEVVSRK